MSRSRCEFQVMVIMKRNFESCKSKGRSAQKIFRQCKLDEIKGESSQVGENSYR
jgi:hypothetical protein